MGFFKRQFLALGTAGFPESLVIDGAAYRLEKAFKHASATAVAVYARGEDRVVCKFHRRMPFFLVPMRWMGHLAAAYEAGALKQLQGLPGVPRFRGVIPENVTVRDFVPGRPLTRHDPVADGFFPLFFELLDAIHARGIAVVDLEKPENILLGEDGRPYLIDFQVAFYWPRRFLGETFVARWLRRRMQRSDRYHAMKHMRRMRPDLLSPEERRRSRQRPRWVRTANFISSPYKKLRRWAMERLGMKRPEQK